MAYAYTTVDGQRVEVTVAANFAQMAAEFKRVWGLSLHVRSGTRTQDEQLRLYNGWINRLPGYNLALHPDNPLAYHVETNPQGPRALDLYDSGNDAGVTIVGSKRNNWIRDNAPRWGFTLSGLTFTPKEGWHVHYTRALTGQGSPAGGTAPGWPARERYGHDWVVAAQGKLKAFGLYDGELDGKDGPATQLGTRALQAVAGLEADGIFGPQTNTVADVILAGRNATSRKVADIQRVVGARIDDLWGPLTSFATYKWQRANGMTADAIWGPTSDSKAFPPAPANPEKQYPTNGRNITGRPTKDIQTFLIGKGFDLAPWGADGDYGQKTSVAVAMYQESVGLEADGIWGPNTDANAFPGVPIPDDPTPVATSRTPVYPGAVAGWSVPLGQADRDGGSIISKLIVHHEAALATQVPYFKTRNDRGSCPTWEVGRDGAVTELIDPARRPSSTGSANTYSVAIETTNTSGDPAWGISDASHEAIAQIAAWLSTQTSFGGVPVRITLDRTSIIGHNEAGVNATACPGPSMRLDWIVERAKAIFAEKYAPQPDPEPEVPAGPDNITLTRAQYDELIGAIAPIEGGIAHMRALIEAISA